MNYLDLFSGIGGFALGAYWAGMKFDQHFFSEVNQYCVDLYQLRFPESIPLGDIREIYVIGNDFEFPEYCIRNNERDYVFKDSTDWIITGGFPCQDISLAGKGAGIEGKRSGLWFEMLCIIRDLRPRFAIIENVSAITFRGLDRVLSSLAEIGYDAEWQDIRASDMGAPHKRERIWILAYPINYTNKTNKRKSREKKEIQSKYRTERCAGMFGRTSDKIPYTDKQHDDISQLEETKIPGSKENGHWSIEPAVGRLVDGIPDRVDRLKGLGNSIVPQIAEVLFKLIKPYLEE